MSHSRRGRETQDSKQTGLQLKRIEPKTYSQSRTFSDFEDGKHLVLRGPAGTGRSFCALFLALRSIAEHEYSKVVILRSARPSVSLGFMPGNLKEKLAYFEEPYVGICNEMYGRQDAYTVLKNHKQIEFASTSYLRGITFTNAVVILDEAQNSTFLELHTVATRIDDDCQLVVIGDMDQQDYMNREVSGFKKFCAILKDVKGTSTVDFNADDCVRSGFVKEYLKKQQQYEHIRS